MARHEADSRSVRRLSLFATRFADHSLNRTPRSRLRNLVPPLRARRRLLAVLLTRRDVPLTAQRTSLLSVLPATASPLIRKTLLAPDKPFQTFRSTPNEAKLPRNPKTSASKTANPSTGTPPRVRPARLLSFQPGRLSRSLSVHPLVRKPSPRPRNVVASALATLERAPVPPLLAVRQNDLDASLVRPRALAPLLARDEFDLVRARRDPVLAPEGRVRAPEGLVRDPDLVRSGVTPAHEGRARAPGRVRDALTAPDESAPLRKRPATATRLRGRRKAHLLVRKVRKR